MLNIDFEFEPFPKIPRLKKRIIVTEKIDGTNGQIAIFGPYPADKCSLFSGHSKCIADIIIDDFRYGLFAGSRKRYITPDEDNFGFAQWAYGYAGELVLGLGPGRHYGEWWGSGIQRRYGLSGGERRFSLFNTMRWHDTDTLPYCVNTVPILADGENLDIERIMLELKATGSHAAPGYMDPEGIVYYHTGSQDRGLFKVTFDHDKGKWNQTDENAKAIS